MHWGIWSGDMFHPVKTEFYFQNKTRVSLMVFIIAAMGSHNFLNFYEHPRYIGPICSTGNNINCIIKERESECTLNYIYHTNTDTYYGTWKARAAQPFVRAYTKTSMCIEKNIVQLVSIRWIVLIKYLSLIACHTLSFSLSFFSHIPSSIYRLRDKNSDRRQLF